MSVLPVPDVSHLPVFRLKKNRRKKHLLCSVTNSKKLSFIFQKRSSLSGRGYIDKVNAVFTRFSSGKIQNSFGVEN